MSGSTADEWEVGEDDGFVFKYRKRQALAPPSAKPDHAEELKLIEQSQQLKEAVARRKKMSLLLARKAKYTAEISDWEQLLRKEEDIRTFEAAILESSSNLENSPNAAEKADVQHEKLHELQLQIEAYEGFIDQLKGLCQQGNRISSLLEKIFLDEQTRRTKGLLNEVALLRNSPRYIIGGLQSQSFAVTIKAEAVATELGQLLAESPIGGRDA